MRIIKRMAVVTSLVVVSCVSYSVVTEINHLHGEIAEMKRRNLAVEEVAQSQLEDTRLKIAKLTDQIDTLQRQVAQAEESKKGMSSLVRELIQQHSDHEKELIKDTYYIETMKEDVKRLDDAVGVILAR